MPPFWKKASVLAAISLASWLVNCFIKKCMHGEKNGSVRPTAGVTPTGSPGCDVLPADGSRIEWMQPNSCGARTSNGSKSFKYGPSDLCCDHPMPMRGIPLAPHQSIMVIPSHEMTACQHHDSCNDVCSDVALPSHGTSLMRCSTACLPGSRSVCSTSLTDDCIVTRVALLLYCLRVRSFRFFLAGELDWCWVTVADGSNCAGGVDDLTASGVDEDGLDLNSAILLFISFISSFMALISSLKLSIIACSAPIVTGASAAAWFVGILLRLVGISLNDRMA